MGWHVKSLDEVVTLQRGFDLPRQDRQPGDVPIVSSSGVSGTHNQARVSAPGVVTGRYGSIGQVHFIETDFWPLNTTLFVKDFKGNDPRFVAYLLQTIDYASCSDKSSVPGVNRNDLHRLRVAVPDLPEQRYIAETLGALDDKIELNRRMNRTLESIARAIFKSWFVDFDPVRKKMEGKTGGELGLPPSLAPLFPDAMFDSQGGELPVGWEAGSLRDLATEVRDSVRPEDIPPGTPYFGLEHLPKRSVALDDWAVADAVASGKSRFVVGDILFGKLRPYFHKVGPPPVDGVCSTDIVVVRPRVPELFSLVLGHVSSREFVEFTNAASSGTRMPRTTWRDMAAYPVAIPPRAVSRAFDSLVRPMVERMHRATGESRALATTRDALLPHLLQGKEGHSFRNPGRQRSPAEVARDMSRLSSS